MIPLLTFFSEAKGPSFCNNKNKNQGVVVYFLFEEEDFTDFADI